MKPVVWTIAGSDPSHGAGIHCDGQSIKAHGGDPRSVITAVTAQNHHRYLGQQNTEARHLADQMDSLIQEHPPKAIKIGLLPTDDSIKTVASFLSHHSIPAVLDPVMATSTGGPLSSTPKALIKIFPYCMIITPNLAEASFLSGIKVMNHDSMKKAASHLLERGCKAVLIKGGHLQGPNSTDLFMTNTLSRWLQSPRSPNQPRGTGCTLSSVIATYLARGLPLWEAVLRAKTYLNYCFQELEPGCPRIYHKSWPPQKAHGCLPKVGLAPPPNTAPFPRPRRPLGVYPIVPRSSWIPRLAVQGITTIQLRIKDLQGPPLESEIIKAIKLAKELDLQLFVNDHWQLALKHKAYGVHLGQQDLEKAPTTLLQKAHIHLGISTHSYQELSNALSYKPSYIALGPIFETTCKSMAFGPQGMVRINEWQALSPVPLVAIGGLRQENAQEVFQRGASGAAVISDILDAPSPEKRLQSWQESWASQHFQFSQAVKIAR